jgi:serine/threonine-protein kinase RsbW
VIVESRTIHIESRTERLIAVRDFVSAAARECGFPDDEVSKIALAVDEACTNVIKHAYRNDPTKQISVTVKSRDRGLEIVIADTGTAFDPTRIQSPNMKEYLSHYRHGGLGMYLMKSLMDKVEYKIDTGRRNEVRMTKYFSR